MSSEFPEKGKLSRATPLGLRFLRAFYDGADMTDKKEIALELGYKSDKVIYKIVNGEQELSFDNLRRFREITGQSIDWLLFGDDVIPMHNDWIRIRNLIGPLRLTDIEALRQDEVARTGDSISFQDFLSDLLYKGARPRRENHELADKFQEMIDLIQSWDLDRPKDEDVGGEVGPIEPAEHITVRHYGKVSGGEDIDQEAPIRKRKTG
ncbi:MAG: hypothetical protein WAU71_04035 [Pyrinomonadaceae bacterium]